jgi:PII-like signaling protein
MSPEGLKLSVYFGERDRLDGRLLSDALMDRLADAGVLASALLRGVEGFGIKHQLRTDRILTLSEDLPLVAVAVDHAPRILRLAPSLAEVVGGGLVTIERVALPGRQMADDLLPASDGAEAKLTVYCGRGEAPSGRPVVGSVVGALRAGGLPGATALAGVDGTIVGERRRARFFSRNAGVPALVVSVGPRERIARVLPRLRALSGRHVITLERVRVVRQAGRALADPPATPAHDDRGLGLWLRVTVHCGERARWEGAPLHRQLVRRLREAGAAGATALRGLVGYSDAHGMHGDRLLAIRRRTPVLVTVVDSVPAMGRLWPLLARATAATGLVTCEVVPAFRATGPDDHLVGGLRLADPGG